MLSAENGGKPLGGRGSAPNPAGEFTALPMPLAGGEVAAAPSQEPHPAVGLRKLGLDFRPFNLAPQ